MRKIYWYVVLVLLVGIIGIVVVQKNTQKDLRLKTNKEVVTIGYRTHDLYAPLFVGIDQKIFEKYNLNVKTVQFESTNQLTDALIGGNIDAALGGVNIPLILTIEDKHPGELVAFSTVNETATTPIASLLVKSSSTIFSIADLRSKKIGAFQGSTAKYLYNKTVVQFFKPEQAELIQMNPELELQALASGQVDAIIVLEPLATIGQSQHITRILESGLFDKFILPNFPNSASVMTTRFKQERPETAKALQEATAEAIDFINSHNKETKEAIVKFLPFEAVVIENIRIPYFLKQQDISLDLVQQEADLLYRDKQLQKQLDVKNIFVL